MKGRSGEIDCRAVSETIYDVRMANAIECDCFVLKVRDERALQFDVGRVLQVEIQGLDDDRARGAFGRGVVVGDVDLRVAATSETLEDIVAAIKSTLLKLQFRHLFLATKGTKSTKSFATHTAVRCSLLRGVAVGGRLCHLVVVIEDFPLVLLRLGLDADHAQTEDRFLL